MTARFDRAAAERRLGSAAVKAIREVVDAAPPLTAEQGTQLRVLLAMSRAPVSTPARRAA